MKTRDFDYLEQRLLAPAIGGSEALTRLESLNLHEEHRVLMEATKAYIDECRKVRRMVKDRVLAQR